jgi:hypothetical protein
VIVIAADQEWRNRIGQDLRFVLDGLMEGPHDRGDFDRPAALGLFHSTCDAVTLSGVTDGIGELTASSCPLRENNRLHERMHGFRLAVSAVEAKARHRLYWIAYGEFLRWRL